MELEPKVRGCYRQDVRSELTEAEARPLAERLAALADPNRLQLLEILGRCAGRVCVCELVVALPLSQPTISHHLRVLRAAGLIDYEKQGIWAYYYVRRDALAELSARLGVFAGDAGDEAQPPAGGDPGVAGHAGRQP